MWGRVSARVEVITGRRGRGRHKRRFGPRVSPSLCFAGYWVMRVLSPLWGAQPPLSRSVRERNSVRAPARMMARF